MGLKGSETFLINAGHGGHDPGATGFGYKEKDLALKICRDIKKTLDKTPLTVGIIRDGDYFLPLHRIASEANKTNAKGFLSIHLNSAAVTTAKGIETFHYFSSANGKRLAEHIQRGLIDDGLGLADRGVKTANFAVIRETKMPAALLELCFINNREDLQFFLDNYDKYVVSISQSILRYMNMNYIIKEEKLEIPKENPVKHIEGKVNIMLLGEHVATEGFLKDGTNYVDINGHYISIREILEKLGLTVGWDNKDRIITADVNKEYRPEKNNVKILLLGSMINVNAINKNDRNCLKIDNAYIPLRNIFESLGFKVVWNNDKGIIEVTS